MKVRYSIPGMLLFCSALFAEPNLILTAASDRALAVGHVASMKWVIGNLSNQTIAVLELKPLQPCEDTIPLMRSLYGSITYHEDIDRYLYDSLSQSATQISVVEGFLPPGNTVSLVSAYRPFSRQEKFRIQYAIVGDHKVYARTGQEGGISFFSPDIKQYSQVILPSLVQLEKREETVSILFEGIAGVDAKSCFCQTLGRAAEELPHSLCKDWDLGKAVLFRVGEEQEGMGPERKSAGWKFLYEYPVFYGDGMYTIGEFIEITPEHSAQFAERIKDYSILKVETFFSDHYYDLEPGS